MVSLKIIGGTRQDSHKCLTCSNATIVKGTCESKDKTICQVVGPIKQIVTECTRYSNSLISSISRQFKSLAYSLSLDFEGNLIWEDPTGKIIKNGKVQKERKMFVRRRSRTIANPVKLSVQ